MPSLKSQRAKPITNILDDCTTSHYHSVMMSRLLVPALLLTPHTATCFASGIEGLMPAQEVRDIINEVKALLQQQLTCLQKVQSAHDTREAKEEYQRLSLELHQTNKVLHSDRAILHFAQFPDEERAIIHIIQELAREISRLKKLNYYGDASLRDLIAPTPPAVKQ